MYYRMKIVKHITFFYIFERLEYVNKIIDEVCNYDHPTDIFIHTNEKFDYSLIHKNTKGKIQLIIYDLSTIHPHYLSWSSRPVMKKQVNDYDVFIYVEDDILIPNHTINYWLKHKDVALQNNYNIGFIRIEKDLQGNEYMTDITTPINKKITIVNEYEDESNKTEYALLNNPYCGCWIYDKSEFTRFIDSDYYDFNIKFLLTLRVNATAHPPGCALIRESSAIGMNDASNIIYKGSIIPISNNQLIDECKIYHLPNNYVYDSRVVFAKLLFTKAIAFDV